MEVLLAELTGGIKMATQSKNGDKNSFKDLS